MPEARRPDPRPADSRDRRPLAVRLCNWVGEVVLAVPTLKRLQAAGYELHLLGKGWAGALLEGEGWTVATRRAGPWQAARQLAELRRGLKVPPRAQAPVALLLTKSFSSALEARLGGWRPVGYAHDGRSVLLARAYPLPAFAHAAHAYWHLASCLLGAEAPYPTATTLTPSAAQIARARAVLDEHALGDGGFVVLCPFSGPDDRERRKVWPGFAELGTRLADRGLVPVVCPGPGEEAIAAERLPGVVRLPGLDLGVYGALMARARAVVANDTGPGHLAAAVGARLIAIYGRQSVAAWAPLGPRVELLHEPGGWPTLERVAASVFG